MRVQSVVMGGGSEWGVAEATADSYVCVACCVQAHGLAVSGSYAYVGSKSDFLAIVGPPTPGITFTLIGSLIDSTVMNYVRRCPHARQQPLYRAPCALHAAWR